MASNTLSIPLLCHTSLVNSWNQRLYLEFYVISTSECFSILPVVRMLGYVGKIDTKGTHGAQPQSTGLSPMFRKKKRKCMSKKIK